MTLKDARKAAGFTQKQLAQRARVDQRLISRLENRQVRLSSYRSVVLICRALGVDPQSIAEFHVPEDK